MIDPRQFLMPFYLNPALLHPNTPIGVGVNPQRMSSGSSFRISDLLESSSTVSDPSPKSETSSISPRLLSPSTERSGSPSSKKARKARTIFTDKQLQELENTFDKQKYLSVQDRMELAHRMGLSDTQVKTWYQNRRTKWKRQASTGMDLLNEPGNLAAVQNLIRNNPYWTNYIPGVPALNFPLLIPPQQPQISKSPESSSNSES